ncbi:ankyrin [Aspergillus sclerotiicarbonarius CBS 121057]|uniref:Ankyrin n=1 Tax=Aspergillus sclerotiicarbonarius (strain CBS 121057 / IBT 28362) TaxID=1448318 RepID=A0A319ELW3_ASPSB|nr:ankyrin [Aspergillus sclerotiicarbonarius CBS 121057]
MSLVNLFKSLLSPPVDKMKLTDLPVEMVLGCLSYLRLEELLPIRLVSHNLFHITSVPEHLSDSLMSRLLRQEIIQDEEIQRHVADIVTQLQKSAKGNELTQCTIPNCYQAISTALTIHNGRAWVLQNRHNTVPWLKDWDHSTMIILAAWMGLTNVVKAALSQSTDANSSHFRLGNLLYAAAYTKDVAMTKDLISYGVSRQRREGVYGDALQLAAYRDSEEIIRVLLASEPRLRASIASDVAYGCFGGAFHAAAAAGNDKLVKMLLERKANPNIPGRLHRTPMFLAARSGRAGVVRQLIENREADPNTSDYMNHSPLLVAVQEGNESVVRVLLGCEYVHVNAAGVKGITPTALLAAAMNGSVRLVKLLLDRPDIDVNRTGQSSPPS